MKAGLAPATGFKFPVKIIDEMSRINMVLNLCGYIGNRSTLCILNKIKTILYIQGKNSDCIVFRIVMYKLTKTGKIFLHNGISCNIGEISDFSMGEKLN